MNLVSYEATENLSILRAFYEYNRVAASAVRRAVEASLMNF
jgi:hypothetical protein